MCRVGVERSGRSVSSSLQHGQIRGYLNTPLPSWPSSDGSKPATPQMLDPLWSTAGNRIKHFFLTPASSAISKHGLRQSCSEMQQQQKKQPKFGGPNPLELMSGSLQERKQFNQQITEPGFITLLFRVILMSYFE